MFHLASLGEFETSPFCHWSTCQSHWNSKFLITKWGFFSYKRKKSEIKPVLLDLSTNYHYYIHHILVLFDITLNSCTLCVPLCIVNCTIIFIYLKLLYYTSLGFTTFGPSFQTVLNDNISKCHNELTVSPQSQTNKGLI